MRCCSGTAAPSTLASRFVYDQNLRFGIITEGYLPITVAMGCRVDGDQVEAVVSYFLKLNKWGERASLCCHTLPCSMLGSQEIMIELARTFEPGVDGKFGSRSERRKMIPGVLASLIFNLASFSTIYLFVSRIHPLMAFSAYQLDFSTHGFPQP